MAGSFGFENDKYDLSVKVGERVLLPAVREAHPSTLLIADGFSCREQIAQLTDRQALHTAEVLALAMEKRIADDEVPPESEIVQRRERARNRSMQRAGVLAGVGIAAVAVLLARNK
ncbi:MAG: hypothetical protein JO260_01130 [Acidobacteria bacterium]|nr:hypothetical protein [Acidobacteriota bacterium]